MNKIEISNLDLHYGSFHALKNINLAIHDKEITAFIGPSGCGKSTLLKSLNRMNDLVVGCKIDGEVLLDGVNIYRDMEPSLLRKRVGMVFQKPNPFPMSIYDNIAFGPRTHGIHSKAKLDDIIGAQSAQCGYLGRTEGQTEKRRIRPFRRPAAAIVHRPCAGGRTGSAADG